MRFWRKNLGHGGAAPESLGSSGLPEHQPESAPGFSGESRARRRRASARVAASLVVVGVTCAAAVGVFAYFLATGSATASASVGTLDAPSIADATPGGGTVALAWSAVTAPATGPVTYYVTRDGGDAAGDCATAVSPSAATSCTDTGLAAGTYHYTVTAKWRSWTSTSGSRTVVVTSGAATKLVFTTGPQTAQVLELTGAITVEREDADGNPVTSGSITVDLSSSSAGGVFRDTGDTTTITSVPIPDGSSSASFAYRDSTAGSPTITAASGSLTSAQQTETINKGDQTIAFGVLADKRFDQSPITVSATASSGLAVTFSSATTSVCTVSGTTVTFLTVGLCTIDANQPGNSTWNPAPQVEQSFTITKGDQTISFGALADKRFDQSPITVGATASSGLTVAFTSATTGVCTVSGATVTFLAVGTCTIDADQAGSSNWNAAPQVQQSFMVTKGNQTITFGTLADKRFDEGAITVAATASSGLTVAFTSATTSVCTASGTTITFVGVGTCTVDADQVGDTNWNAAPQVQRSFTITKGNQTIAFGALAGKRFDEGPITVGATASSGLTVAFASATPGVCTTGGTNGTTVTFVSVGTCTINANQAGDANWNAAAQVQQSFTISKGNQTISFGTIADRRLDQSPFTVSATATSGLSVTFSSATTLVCTVSGSSVTLIKTGTCTINANQAGDTNWNAAAQFQQSFSVQKGNQSITFGALANKRFDEGPVTVSATASSGLTVTFTSATTGVCTVSGTTITFLTVGVCTINANQAGDTNWNAAAQEQQSFTISKGNQTITFTSSAPTGARTGGPSYTPAATASSGLAVTFAIDASATSVCSISSGVVSFNAIGTCVVDANQAGNTSWNAAPQVQQSFNVVNGAVVGLGIVKVGGTGAPVVSCGSPSATYTCNVIGTGNGGTVTFYVTFVNAAGTAVVYSAQASTINETGNDTGTVVIPANTSTSNPNTLSAGHSGNSTKTSTLTFGSFTLTINVSS